MLNVYTLFGVDGWNFVGNCTHEEISMMAGMYADFAEQVLFVDDTIELPLKISTATKHMTPDLDNVSKLVVKSMFDGLPTIVLVVKSYEFGAMVGYLDTQLS